MPRPVRPTRFGADEAGRAPGVLEGYQRAVSPRIDKGMIKRNLADYGIKLSDAQGLSDQQKYDLAARKVIAKYKALTDAVIKATTSKGTQTIDTFSLKGVSQALDRVNQECN